MAEELPKAESSKKPSEERKPGVAPRKTATATSRTKSPAKGATSKGDMNVTEALKKHFGFDSFKGDQKAIIETLLSGKDVFVLMPTGGGKSLCYQLPSLMMEGTAIVISPLIALMKNQVDAMRNFSEADGVAHFINSSPPYAAGTSSSWRRAPPRRTPRPQCARPSPAGGCPRP